MRIATLQNRWIASALLATTAILSLASVALADHGRGNGNRRYKGDYGNGAPYSRRVVVERRHSDAGPVLAGLIGGYILGSAASRSQPVVVQRHDVYSDRGCGNDQGGYRYDSRYGDDSRCGGYRNSGYGYYDPYGDDWYDSLDECRLHCRDQGHLVVIRVIDLSSGNCVRTMRYSNGGWQRFDERGWNDGRARNRDWRRSDGWNNRNQGDGEWDDRRGGDDED